MRQLAGRIWRLTKIALSGPGAWIALVTYAFVLGLQFFSVWITLQMITWNKAFYDALEQMNAPEALRQIGVFFILTGFLAGAFLIGEWLRKRLLMRLRTRLTVRALDLWVGARAYWYLRPGFSAAPVDNPDQRVAEDCRQFVERLLLETLDLISNIVALVTYVALLWSLSDFPLSFSVSGYAVEIPRYMVILAFLYVLISSVATHLLGRPLKALIFSQEKHEADFRHALIQLREEASPIAQSRGEPAETRRLMRLFGEVRGNWNRLIRREFILGLFARPYFQTVLRVPTFFALPAYFAGAVTLGGLMQLASAFSNVATTLSWFILSYRDLAQFVAVSERLDGLFTAAASPVPRDEAPQAISRAPSASGGLELQGLRLFTPEGRALAPVPDLSLAPGGRLWVSGASGAGKSTLVAAISGLWPYGEGRIGLPAEPVTTLSQEPRLFPESLTAAACYPLAPGDCDPDRISIALRQTGLDQVAPEAPLKTLSGGERQRLGFARLLVSRPDFIILDEATSALDPDAAAAMLTLLARELPGATILCVSHDEPAALSPHQRLSLG
ncbi:ABC transporter ATP-binding protein/permease [Pseudogemmobacter bohemicus]|uniref:ABC transporter ATP-binding protein/permease n=1 Tax=Pseudogemmobacter bohemicus TaxID=2250708 RepID=UPI000DD37FC8|nr:SbmA/BacA-like family transporter [Pseudogemmobacter bohemicus]